MAKETTKRKKSVFIAAIVGVFTVALAGPGAASFFEQRLAEKSLNDLAEDILFARREAADTGTPITMCQSSDGEQCSGTGRWEDGWIVFEDHNRNGATDRDEEVLSVSSGALMGTIRAVEARDSKIFANIAFSRKGLPRVINGGGQSQNGVFQVCSGAADSNLGMKFSSAGSVFITGKTTYACF